MNTETPIACTLDAADATARAEGMRELGARALVGLDVTDDRARLRFRGERERVDARVAAERECCAFFEFMTTNRGGDVELDVRAPAGGEPLLRGLVAAVVAGWEGALG